MQPRKALRVIAATAVVMALGLTGCGGGGGTANNAPVINSLTPAANNLWPGGSTTIACNASDADGDALTYTWTANGGLIAGSGNTITWNAPNATATYEVHCKVEDGKGGSVTRSVNVTVRKATVEGTVVDVSSSEGVAGVQVTIDGATATTDANGDFSVTGVGQGTHTVQLDPPNPYVQVGGMVEVTVGDPTTIALDQPLGVFDSGGGGGPPPPPPF